jgi:hypothetical protein
MLWGWWGVNAVRGSQTHHRASWGDAKNEKQSSLSNKNEGAKEERGKAESTQECGFPFVYISKEEGGEVWIFVVLFVGVL